MTGLYCVGVSESLLCIACHHRRVSYNVSDHITVFLHGCLGRYVISQFTAVCFWMKWVRLIRAWGWVWVIPTLELVSQTRRIFLYFQLKEWEKESEQNIGTLWLAFYHMCKPSHKLLRQPVDFEHATKQFYWMYFMTRSQGVRAKKNWSGVRLLFDWSSIM